MIAAGAAVGFALSAPFLVWAIREQMYVLNTLLYVIGSTALVAGTMSWLEAIS